SKEYDTCASHRAALKRLSAGDVANIRSQIAPGAVWRQSRTLPWGGDHRGPEGRASSFRSWARRRKQPNRDRRNRCQPGVTLVRIATAHEKVAGTDWPFG